jgi:hypothetical protein
MTFVHYRADPWSCEWALIKETLIDALGVKENDTETIIKLVETFAKMELRAIEQYEEQEAVRISHLPETANDDLDIEF